MLKKDMVSGLKRWLSGISVCCANIEDLGLNPQNTHKARHGSTLIIPAYTCRMRGRDCGIQNLKAHGETSSVYVATKQNVSITGKERTVL